MEGMDFLHKGERVELDIHRYRGALLLLLVVWMLPAALILAGFYYANHFASYFGQGLLYVNIALLALLALDFLIAYAWMLIYSRYRLILTNRRIMIVTQYGLSGHRVAQCNLDFIQDVSTNHPNFLAELLGYGDVIIETSGKEERFIFPTCQSPHIVAAKVVELCKAEEAAEAAAETPVPAPEPARLPAVTSADSPMVQSYGAPPQANVFYERMPDLPFEIPTELSRSEPKSPVEQ